VTRTLLIDADIIAYQTSASNEVRVDWDGDGNLAVAADFEAAQRAAKETIDQLVEQLKATDVVICLSDDFDNFRKDFFPTYKGNRSSTQRPEHLYDMKEWLAENYPARLIKRLEADDVMGIMSTEPHKGERIIVSQDKDMQTIPGLLFNPNKDKKVRRITPEAAERFLFWQTICGDQTDGYPGCPGAGPGVADPLLDEGRMYVQRERTLKSGPRKGLVLTEWVTTEDLAVPVWQRIVSVYEKAGLTEADAIVQINLARILKHGEWDGKRVIPWEPPRAN
jgi:DNA polymerase-1